MSFSVAVVGDDFALVAAEMHCMGVREDGTREPVPYPVSKLHPGERRWFIVAGEQYLMERLAHALLRGARAEDLPAIRDAYLAGLPAVAREAKVIRELVAGNELQEIGLDTDGRLCIRLWDYNSGSTRLLHAPNYWLGVPWAGDAQTATTLARQFAVELQEALDPDLHRLATAVRSMEGPGEPGWAPSATQLEELGALARQVTTSTRTGGPARVAGALCQTVRAVAWLFHNAAARFRGEMNDMVELGVLLRDGGAVASLHRDPTPAAQLGTESDTQILEGLVSSDDGRTAVEVLSCSR